MRILLIILLLGVFYSSTLAQKQTYKFYQPEDSTIYNSLNEIFRSGWVIDKNTGLHKFSEDKVGFSYRELRDSMDAIPKYAYLTYNKNPDYTSLEEMMQSDRKDTITALSISSTNIKRIPTFQLIKCKNLKSIELVGTSVKRIPWLLNWSIFGLDQLKTLKVYNHKSENALKFSRNTSIIELVYRENPFTPLPKYFHKLKKVEKIDFVRNDFTEKDEFNLQKLKSLNLINLARNSIKIENLARDTVKNLKNIVLSFNNLNYLPDHIALFPHLKDLQLAENKIESDKISPEIGQLKKLQVLSFYKNNLDSLPLFLLNFPELIELDLYYNKIEIIPKEINQLKRIERLYLANNRLYSIPETIGQLSHLKELYLHHNRISYLPESFCQLTNITDFHIHNNYFHSFPMCILEFEKLEDLDVSFNSITQIPKEIRSLENLQYLWMRGLVFETNTRSEAEEMQETFKILQERGVKVSIELD